MKWSHLPEAGGIFAQDPVLLEGFRYIFSARAKYESEKAAAEERKRGMQSPSRGRGKRR